MTLEHLTLLVNQYRSQFEARGIPKKKMSDSKTFGSTSSNERLAHAHYLLDGILEYARDPAKADKTGRHLASVQMILSFENWFTLGELKAHNRSST